MSEKGFYMRINHSIKNISMGLLTQIIMIILGFLSRKVFLDNLGSQYLGINGLLTNVISMMVLIEGGIAISIVYNLYKPLADKNKPQIIALIQLYKKAYAILAMIVLVFSLGLYPFLHALMKDSGSISNLTIIYFLFVGKSMISYLNAHKWSLINADQRGYILQKVSLIIKIVTMIGKMAILIVTQNYILFLLLDLILFILENVMNGLIVNRRYPYIRTKKTFQLDLKIKDNIVKNVKAMFLHNVGGYLVNSTDNILISTLIGIGTVGLYSNYTMITQQLKALIGPILGGIGAGVGHLIATEDKDKSYSIFKVAYLVNFWVYSLSVIFLYILLDPFISWWLGEQYVLSQFTFTFILINFYLNGMRTAITTFKNKAGLFSQDKYFSIIEGVINLILSLILVKHFGLAGIFMGTTISAILTVFWTQPYIVYTHLFKKTVWSYFIRYSYYILLTLLVGYITDRICHVYITGIDFESLVLRGIIALGLPNIIYLAIFFKTKEFQYIYGVIYSKTINKWRVQKQVKRLSQRHVE